MICVDQVAGLDEDNSRVMVAMALGGDIVTVSQNCVRLVSKQEYDKCHKYLSQSPLRLL